MIADSPMAEREESAFIAWDEYASAVERFSRLVQHGAGRHEMLRQHEHVMRTENRWKQAYADLLAPAGQSVQ